MSIAEVYRLSGTQAPFWAEWEWRSVMRRITGELIGAQGLLNAAAYANRTRPLQIRFDVADEPESIVKLLRRAANREGLDLFIESYGPVSMTLWATPAEPESERVRRAMDQPTGY